MPELAVMVTDVLAFDHLRHEVTVLANVLAEGDVESAYGEAAAAIAEVRERLRGPVPPGAGGEARAAELRPNLGPDGYARSVERAKEYIRAGDIYQVVPSQRWSAACPVEAFSICTAACAPSTPARTCTSLDFEDFEIAGASPESLVKVNGRRVEQRPLAGTRPRAGSTEEDLRRGRELLADPKERAEHVMLVDLGRNDLGRVCEYGSVTVDELMVVETYSHVMHIVVGLRHAARGVSAMDALSVSLPAGTLSGAPKIRAMQIIDELEPVKRGPYGGAVGYLSYTGDLDTCIYIRSALVKDGDVHVQAGGGIVADSEPAYEVREIEAKSGAVMDAIGSPASRFDWG